MRKRCSEIEHRPRQPSEFSKVDKQSSARKEEGSFRGKSTTMFVGLIIYKNFSNCTEVAY